MVSISSWVTHTLPDGYRVGGGQSPRDRVAAAVRLVIEVRQEGQAVLKKKSSTTVSQ